MNQGDRILKPNNDCSVVKDLYPLSRESLLNEKTAEFVKTHLAKCPECAKYAEEFDAKARDEAAAAKKNDKKIVRMLKARRYELTGFLIGIVIILCIPVALTVYSYIKAGSSSKLDISAANPAEVSYAGGKDYYLASKLLLLPADVPENPDEYVYRVEGSKGYPNCRIYIEMKYDEAEYEAEKTRLLNVTDPETGDRCGYSETECVLPCVYAMLYDIAYEYALLDDENHTVRYIYLQSADRYELEFDTKFLPKDYGRFGYDFETEREAFSIYGEESPLAN